MRVDELELETGYIGFDETISISKEHVTVHIEGWRGEDGEFVRYALE